MTSDHTDHSASQGQSPPSEADCEAAIRRLYDFLDGELTIDRKEVVQAHLQECSHCLEAYDFEADLRALISRRCREEVPGHLRERIARMLAEDTSAN